MSTQLNRSPAYVYNFEDRQEVSEIIRQKFQGNIIEFSKLSHLSGDVEAQLAPAKNQPVSLFLVDINLKPGESRVMKGSGSGVKIIKLIKDKVRSAMVVAYSTDDGYKEESIENGADAFLHKSNSDDSWDIGLEEVKSKFLLQYNNISLTTPLKKDVEDPIINQKILAWIRDIDETEARVEIECEIKGKMERRFINAGLLTNFKELYSGQAITIVISNDNGKILIEFADRDEPDQPDENPFEDPKLQNSPIFQIPDIKPS